MVVLSQRAGHARGSSTTCAGAAAGADTASCLTRRTTTGIADRGVGPALGELERAARADPRVSAACHGAMHPVGRAAFARDGSWAPVRDAQRVAGQCANGFIHGYVGAAVEAGDDDAVERAARTCAGMFPQRSGAQSVQDCVHGLGHGARRSGTLDSALDACDRVAARPTRFECFGGALMEDQTTPDGYGSKLTAAPCTTQRGDRALACYLYLPTRSALGRGPIVRLCSAAATADERSTCAFAAAARIGAGADPVDSCRAFVSAPLQAACARGYFSNEVVSYHRLSTGAAARTCAARHAAGERIGCGRALGAALRLGHGAAAAATQCARTVPAVRAACAAGTRITDVLTVLSPSKAT